MIAEIVFVTSVVECLNAVPVDGAIDFRSWSYAFVAKLERSVLSGDVRKVSERERESWEIYTYCGHSSFSVDGSYIGRSPTAHVTGSHTPPGGITGGGGAQ